MATLMGAVISDGLENGQVVSGVGGQYNFVAQAFALEGARSVPALEATRTTGAKVQSNIRWRYGHETVPRHLRDIIVTEYGIADLRGKSDADVIAAMLRVVDSRFQDDLAREAKDAGKLPRNFELPAAYRENFPERIASALRPAREDGLLPAFPFGSDLTPAEQRLIPALLILQQAEQAPLRLAALASEGLTRTVEAADAQCLERLGLHDSKKLSERVYRALVMGALARSKADI
jgi:Acetyl-CoA hydrolase/transferase C-terminal domain